MTDGVPDVAGLQGVVCAKLILQREVVALRVRRFDVVILSQKGNAAGLDRSRGERNGRESCFQGSNRTIGKSDRGIRGQARIIEIELKRKIDVRLDDRVFEAAEEKAVSPASYQLRRKLIGKAHPRRKVQLLRLPQTWLAGANDVDVIRFRSRIEIRRQSSIAASFRQQEFGRTGCRR